MLVSNFKKPLFRISQGSETRFVVSARWTNADAFVLTILEGSQVHASELGVSEPTKSQLS